MTQEQEMFFSLGKLGDGIGLCPKVRGNPGTTGKRVTELAGAVT